MRQLQRSPTDEVIYSNEIRPWLPRRIFDAHCHLTIDRFHRNLVPPLDDPLLHDVDMAALKQWWQLLLPDCQVNGLVLPFPTKGCDRDGQNDYLGSHVTDPQNRFSIIVHPAVAAEKLDSDIRRLHPFGLKPYLCFAQVADPQQATITEMIPEPQIALADKYGLAVTLHVSKPRGMADEDNIAQLTRLVRDYPHCKFILAHCGRCFITVNMADALQHLPVAENLWIDTSAVCDIGVFVNLLSKYDLTRLCFGTDLVAGTGFRGTYVPMGMSWDMCSAEMVTRPGGQNIAATFAAYENLRALIHAARFCQLSETDLQNIFYDNAANLCGIDDSHVAPESPDS